MKLIERGNNFSVRKKKLHELMESIVVVSGLAEYIFQIKSKLLKGLHSSL